ncbi:hypothetical protein ACLOJK_038777 [Asimina triloba]
MLLAGGFFGEGKLDAGSKEMEMLATMCCCVRLSWPAWLVRMGCCRPMDLEGVFVCLRSTGGILVGHLLSVAVIDGRCCWIWLGIDEAHLLPTALIYDRICIIDFLISPPDDGCYSKITLLMMGDGSLCSDGSGRWKLVLGGGHCFLVVDVLPLLLLCSPSTCLGWVWNDHEEDEEGDAVELPLLIFLCSQGRSKISTSHATIAEEDAGAGDRLRSKRMRAPSLIAELLSSSDPQSEASPVMVSPLMGKMPCCYYRRRLEHVEFGKARCRRCFARFRSGDRRSPKKTPDGSHDCRPLWRGLSTIIGASTVHEFQCTCSGNFII